MRIVPQGHLIIARRLNAGLGVNNGQVPEGRPKSCPTQPSLRDSVLSLVFPALKRRATLEKSLRDCDAQNLICPRAQNTCSKTKRGDQAVTLAIRQT